MPARKGPKSANTPFENATKPAAPVQDNTPQAPAQHAATKTVTGAIDKAAEIAKNNKEMAGAFLRRSPLLGILAGAALSSKTGRDMADKAIDTAAGLANRAVTGAADRFLSPGKDGKKDNGPKP